MLNAKSSEHCPDQNWANSVEGCDLQVGSEKNSHRDSHRKDMSSLIQGSLNCRSACDTMFSYMVCIHGPHG